jgi:hypothetical protein
MKHLPVLSAILFSALLAAAGTAYAQQPPDVVNSDSRQNTAMGTGALLNLDTNQEYDHGNTAAGYQTLYSNTEGYQNSAFGEAALFSNSTGPYNTAVGAYALQFNTTGGYNAAFGMLSLNANTNGGENTALGYGALLANTTGSFNAASGAQALEANTTGSDNTADGMTALYSNTTGSGNTASGYAAMVNNTTGDNNTAFGNTALNSNSTGNKNVATGYQALYFNTSGGYNTASGYQALYSNLDGIRNTAFGDWGLYSNTHGSDNTAAGQGALYSSTTGSYNIGLGANAGYNLTSGSNNIEIGNEGTSSDGGIIRIGAAGTHTATYIAGIENAKVTGAAVYITSSGQLGVLASSERYKTAIAPMGAGTEKLQELRPVSFHLKTDANGPVQYGLIAEEVAKVYPELVIRDQAGKIQGVRYDELAPMLLNEVQKQQTIAVTLVAQHEVDAVKLDTQAAKIASLEQQLSGIQAALANLQPHHQLVAQR